MNALDNWILTALFASRTPLVTHLMIVVSAFGEWTILVPVALLAAIGLHASRHTDAGVGLMVSVFGAGAGVLALKAIFQTPRPPLRYQAVQELWYSFPSAHAALALAFWGYAAYLVYHERFPKRSRSIAAFACIAWAGLIAFSRLYLGVHYFSDILGGFAVGGLFLFLGIRRSGADRIGV